MGKGTPSLDACRSPTLGVHSPGPAPLQAELPLDTRNALLCLDDSTERQRQHRHCFCLSVCASVIAMLALCPGGTLPVEEPYQEHGQTLISRLKAESSVNTMQLQPRLHLVCSQRLSKDVEKVV